MSKRKFVVAVEADSDADGYLAIITRGMDLPADIRPMLVPTPGIPKVWGLEVLVVRDPDGDTEVSIWFDGEPVAPDAEEHVDPGRGYLLDEWREETEYTRDSPILTPAFKEAVIAARDAAESSPYITE